jgi:ABC-2 type transport system ATP-binding protein
VPAIQIGSLTKSYGDLNAIDDLSLTISEGELFGLLGPNGAGKTTTMEILTGQLTPDSGEATVLDVDPVEHPTTVRERVGILPETESPPSFLTAREYFEFVGAVRGISDAVVDERTETWADRLGFSDKLDTLSTDLSRGQQQKVMITAAFLHEPALVFIDEPLANLDPIVQERLKRFFREYRDAGNTLVITTHDVDVAAELCSRVGIMHTGRLVADVRPSELSGDRTLLDVFLERVDGDETPTTEEDGAAND